MSVIKVRFKGDEVWFDEWGDDLKVFISKIESALGVKAKKHRFLIFVVRYDFVIDDENVLLAIDEDGTAYIGLGKNSARVKQKVIEQIRQSGDFREG